MPRLATLRRLAEAHGLPLNEYLGELGRRAAHSRSRTARERADARTPEFRGKLPWKGDLDELRGRDGRHGSDVMAPEGTSPFPHRVGAWRSRL